jgi:hypothetical protein
LSEGDTLTFTDASGCGFGSSAGTFNSPGADGNENTVTSSAGGLPSNYWDFDCTMPVTADYTTFEKFSKFDTTGAINIDYCTFQDDYTNDWTIEIAGAVTSFTNNTITRTEAGTGAYAFKSNTAHAAFDNIVITGAVASAKSVEAKYVKLEFSNSNFDVGDANVNTSGANIISKNHNDTADLYEMLIGSAGLSFSSITNEFSTDADVKLREGTLTMDEDNKVCDTFNVYSGATVKVSDGKDWYVQQTFDNDGTWDQTAGFGGDIHVGDFTPFDSGDIIDATEFIDTGFHDISHYLEMDL